MLYFFFANALVSPEIFVEKGVIQKRLGGCENKEFPDNKGSVLKRHHNSVCHHHNNHHHHHHVHKDMEFNVKGKVDCEEYI